MRIIAGQFRRRPLKAPRGYLTRPSTDRTRESLFNLVANRIELEGTHVLDLFAGSGALGLEALSRGARSAVFVESDPRVLRFVRMNAESLGVTAACQFTRADATVFVSRYSGSAFDLILADPPYDLPAIPDLPDAALTHVVPGGLFVLEHDVHHRFDEHPRLITARAYGRTVVSIFAAES